MVAPQALINELRLCVTAVRAGGRLVGAGFFVTPTLVATSRDVIGRPDVLTVEIDGEPAAVSVPRPGEDTGVAILGSERRSEHHVALSDEAVDGDALLTWVPDETPGGWLPIRLLYRTTGAGDGGHVQRDAGTAHLQPGAPLLNLRTGLVCGMLTGPEGEMAAAPALLAARSAAADGGLPPGDDASEWLDCMDRDSCSRGLGDRDARTLRGEQQHFRLFDHEPVDVRDLFIEPHYRRYRVDNADRVERQSTNVLADCLAVLDGPERVLFVTGGYGSGKTTLAKKLHDELATRGSDVLFVEAPQLRQDAVRGQLGDRAQERRWGRRHLYVIVDEFDALLAPNQAASDKGDAVLGELLRLAQRPGFHVAIFSRDGVRHEKLLSDRVLNFAYWAFSELERLAIDVIELRAFRKPEQGRWLEAYAVATRGIDVGLRPHHLEEIHKHILRACRTPLFLYLLALEFHQTARFGNVYDLYATFVDRTAQGKFGGPAPQLVGIATDYRDFLRSLAERIAQRAQLRFSDPEGSEVLLDPNCERYAIESAEIEPLVEKFGARYAKAVDSAQQRRFETTLLTCYFLEEVDETWRFRDNNVLFFLLAEQHVKCLDAAVEAYRSGELEAAERALEPIGSSTLHAVAVDLVLHRLRALPREEQVARAELLIAILGLRASDPPLAASDAESLTRRLALILSLLTLQRQDQAELPLLFPDLRWHILTAERLGLAYTDIVRRSFRDVGLYQLTMCDMDLDGYDFSRASLGGVTFERCSLRSVRMCNLDADKVRFKLCDVDLDLRDATGTLCFDDCRVRLQVPSSAQPSLSLKLGRCNISSIEVHGGHAPQPVQLELRGCRFEKLHVRGCKRGWSRVTLVDCTYNHLAFYNSRIELSLSQWSPSPARGYHADDATSFRPP